MAAPRRGQSWPLRGGVSHGRSIVPRRVSPARGWPGDTVGDVLHPVGSLPPRVYWKRRILGIAVVLLLAVVPFLLLGGGGASEAADGVDPQPTGPPAATPQLELVPAQPLQTTTAAPSTSPPEGSGQPSGSAPAPPTDPPATDATTTPPPAEPVACTDKMLTVTASSEQPKYSAQDRPTLLMTVQNSTAQPCTRDIGTAQQEWGLFDGEVRLWGSNDCLSEPVSDVQILKPGQEVVLRVEWSGLTSDRACAQPRKRLPPGDYQLRARIGGVQSPNATLTLT